jgi:DNA (cytosine-5)-methyltransferase 1
VTALTLKLIDLFSGCGGLSMGFQDAGYEVLEGVDHDRDALDAFRLNHPRAKTWHGKIEDLDPLKVLADVGLVPGELDLLVGGPPCQGFSRNRARRHVRGQFVDDPRNYLFSHFLRCVEAMNPRAVLIENVADMIVKQDGAFEQEIRERLDDLGYHYVSAKVLNAADYGVPQRRRRAIFVAGRDAVLTLPAPTHCRIGSGRRWLTIWEAISDLPRLQEGQGSSPCRYDAAPATQYQQQLRRGGRQVTEHVAWTMSPTQRERLTYLAEGDGADKLPAHLAPKSGYGSAYRRMARDIPALTITTWLYHPGSGMFWHPVDDRTITLREAARLQSFPDAARFVGGKLSRCRQVGNAVPPLLARRIAEHLAAQLI